MLYYCIIVLDITMPELWTVVKFIDEDSVEAVPTNWIIDGKCYWPPFHPNKLRAAIQKMKLQIRNGLYIKCQFFVTAHSVIIYVYYICVNLLHSYVTRIFIL